MFIQTEQTPNPQTLKFLPGRMLLTKGTVDFPDDRNAAQSPLASKLFAIDGVKGVFISRDFVTVTKGDDLDWLDLKAPILAAIMDQLTSDEPILTAEAEAARADSNGTEADSEVIQQIKELLETRIRPAVAADGGDILFDRFEEGIVFLEMRGSCAGCPSSTATLKQGVENMMKHYIPQVVEVRSVNGQPAHS